MSDLHAVYIGLCNPKSPGNVGSIMRAAGCYQAQAIRYTGRRYDQAAKFHTDTKNVSREIPLVGTDDLVADLPDAMQVVCVELVEGATPLPTFTHPDCALYVFGPEDASVPQALVDRADHVVYVPTIGCMNLAATVNVLLYDRLSKSTATINHQQRIQASRDMNNQLVVKATSSE